MVYVVSFTQDNWWWIAVVEKSHQHCTSNDLWHADPVHSLRQHNERIRAGRRTLFHCDKLYVWRRKSHSSGLISGLLEMYFTKFFPLLVDNIACLWNTLPPLWMTGSPLHKTIIVPLRKAMVYACSFSWYWIPSGACHVQVMPEKHFLNQWKVSDCKNFILLNWLALT